MATIALYGSGEFLPWSESVDRWCLERAPEAGPVLVAPVASAPEGEAVFARWAAMGLEHYAGIGVEASVLEVRTRADAEEVAAADAIAGARMIFFSGGNPGYLAETLRRTLLWEAVARAAAAGTVIAGCSAGAVFLGTRAPFIDGMAIARWVPGVHMLRRAYLAPHFDALDSYAPGLRATIAAERPAGSTLIGLDESTALHGDGETWQVTGSGAVWAGEELASLTQYRDGDSAALPLGLRLP